MQWIDLALMIGIIVMVIVMIQHLTRPIEEHSCPSCNAKKPRPVPTDQPESDFRIGVPFPKERELIEGVAACPPMGEYSVLEISHFLSDEMCDSLIHSAYPILTPSQVYHADAPQHRQSTVPQRISHQATLRNEDTKQVATQLSELIGMEDSHFEDIQVIRYEKGGHFDYHYDTNPSNKTLPSSSRIITLMVYLNDDYEGGETEFPMIHKKVKPQKGKAVLFWSVRPMTTGNELIRESVHKGSDVRSGEKWICNLWVHSEPFLPDARFL